MSRTRTTSPLRNPADNGMVTDVGSLEPDATSTAGFGIEGAGNRLAMAAECAEATGPFTPCSVPLAQGAATLYNPTSGIGPLQIRGARNPATWIAHAIGQ